MPHHGGLLNELENDLERLVIGYVRRSKNAWDFSNHFGSASQSSQQNSQQNGPYMQQPVGYGQMGGNLQYQQPFYGVQPQMMGIQPQMMAMQPQMMGMQPQMVGMQSQMMRPVPVGAQMDPYGRVLIDSGDGTPARIYGGQFEGSSATQTGYQVGYAAQPGAYMTSVPQGGRPQYLVQQPQRGMQQGAPQSFPPISQPGYQQFAQGYAQNPQPSAQSSVSQLSLPSPQQSYQSTPQYSSQNIQERMKLSPQSNHTQIQPVSSSPPQSSNSPGTIYSPTGTLPPSYTPEPQSQVTHRGQESSQPTLQSTTSLARQTGPGAEKSTTPGAATQSIYTQDAKVAYQPTSQAPPQNWTATNQHIMQTGYIQVSQPAYSMSYSNNPSPNPSFQRLPIQSQTSFQQLPIKVISGSYGPEVVRNTSSQAPAYLDDRDTEVRFQTASHKADTHHHALKALHSSPQTVEALTGVLGTYLLAKKAHENHHIYTAVGGYRHSRPEVQIYSSAMDKIESLSSDYISKHKSTPLEWKSAFGPHRRAVFATLYNNNELVRAFCSEINGGPLMLPDLDSYALGKTLTNFNFARAATRPPAFNAGYQVLSQVRTVILIDDSGSMTEPGHSSWGFRSGMTETRWTQARNMLAELAPFVASYNPQGIDLHFLNRVPFYGGLKTSAAVQAAFDSDYPSNGTPTGQRVNDILDAYMCCLRHYRSLLPLNLIVITDGEANDEHILHWTIEHHVTKIVHRGFPAHQFGIEFVQVGDCEHATRHLEKLEEEVSRHHLRFQRDVVGVTPTTRIGRMDGEKLLGIAVSGIDARMNGYMRMRGVNV